MCMHTANKELQTKLKYKKTLINNINKMNRLTMGQ